MEVKIYVELCRESAVIPEYSNLWDAGMDIICAEDTLIRAGETALVPTGLKMAIPKGYEIQVRPRSGISLKSPLRISNSPGTIDCGYRDEVGIIMTNTSSAGSEIGSHFYLSSKEYGMGDYLIQKGDRVAQIVLCEVPRISFEKVDSVRNLGKNRGGGFGSTGVR